MEFREGLLYTAVLPTRRVYVLDPKTWEVQSMWQLAGNRAHGVGWDDDTLWVADTNWRAFFRHDRKTGEIVEKIQLTESDPLIHGVTVHAAGGRAMMEDAKAAAPTGTKVVAVTVLTSLDGNDLNSIGLDGDPHRQVERLTDLARTAGLDGVVCSGNEVAAGRAAWPEGFFVVPGVRLAGAKAADQKRVITPSAAIDAGASIIVVGRPITEAADPDGAARAIAATL